MAKLSVDQVLLKAKSFVKKGKIEEAEKLYQMVLQAFPENKRAQQGFASINKPEADPPEETIIQLVNLYNQGQLAAVIEQATSLTEQYPKAFIVWNILGTAHRSMGCLAYAFEAFSKATELNPIYPDVYINIGNALKDQGKLDEAIEAYTKASTLKPDYAEAYFNIGNALKDQGKLDEAVEVYNKALVIKPDYAEAYNNIGIALQEQGKLDEAIASYNKALSIKPDHAVAYNNMGVALNDQGKLDEAIEVYKKALALKPDYADAYDNMGTTLQDQGKLGEAIASYTKSITLKPNYIQALENSQSLVAQLLPSISKCRYEFYKTDTELNPKIVLRPKYQILNAIQAFLEADFSKAQSHINNFRACDQNLLGELTPQDRVFCEAYSQLIAGLSGANQDEVLASDIKDEVYHLGESHCLSYAHQNIMIGGYNFRVAPRITFGAKAFHFSRNRRDSFKAITRANFLSLPKSSRVFLSFGEIDCRPNEGFISAARKTKKSIEQLITETVFGYVQWFLEQNQDQNHQLYFFNVPAPAYDKDLTLDLNSEVARTVALFNAALKKHTLQHHLFIVDVFQFTVSKNGFSNGRFHLDNRHLGAKAIPEIEQQFTC
jgi:tetratricopeptide (TPR) repeat protein